MAEKQTEKKCLQEKIADARKDLHDAGLKESGANTYAGFSYFELKDYIPKVVDLEQKHRFTSTFSIKPAQNTDSEKYESLAKIVVKD
jgi:hypothetical protein